MSRCQDLKIENRRLSLYRAYDRGTYRIGVRVRVEVRVRVRVQVRVRVRVSQSIEPMTEEDRNFLVLVTIFRIILDVRGGYI